MRTYFDHSRISLLVVAATVLGLTACSTVAPMYQATNENVQVLQAGPNSKLTTGDFKSGGDKRDELNKLTIRGGSFASPYDGSYTNYLKEAIRVELEAAGLWDPKANVRISGELLDNWLDGSGASVGDARITARFVVERAGSKAYDKTLTAKHEWESSFMGPVAIPAAQRGYVTTVKKLVNQLFSDKDFQGAVRK